MLKIKLMRTGKSGTGHYRIVIAEGRSKATGRFIDNLGWYSPQNSPADFKIDRKKLADWQKKGAQPTATIRHLLNKNG